jgi:outer membrane immunogenic protein
MKQFFAIGAAVAAIAAAAPASAQDFTGPRIEARAGWDGTSINIRDTRDFGGRGTFGASSYSSDFLFGAEAGFDVQVGRLVVGAYGGIDITDADEPFQRELVTFHTSRNITVGGRIGYAFGPRVLVYGKAGYSNGRLTPTFQTGANQAPYAGFDRDRDGMHFGGGVELAVRQGLYVRADYTHHSYDEFDLNTTTELRFKRDQISGAVGFRF